MGRPVHTAFKAATTSAEPQILRSGAFAGQIATTSKAAANLCLDAPIKQTNVRCRIFLIGGGNIAGARHSKVKTGCPELAEGGWIGPLSGTVPETSGVLKAFGYR